MRLFHLRRPRLRLVGILALLGSLLLSASGAQANMGNPVEPGQVVGEPSPELQSVAISAETLDLDLRPLAADQPARVAATYHVNNAGPATTLPLLFVAASLAAGANAVRLDGVPVAAQVVPKPSLPDAWRPPATTPGLAGGSPLVYHTSGAGALAFRLTLASGRHTIAVQYAAKASAYSDDSPARYWQLGYVLAPARQWASFGRLDVTVETPFGWSAASAPALARAPTGLRGTFTGVPADALAITTQAPIPATPTRWPWAVLAGAAALALAATIGALLGRFGRSAWWGLPIAAMAAVAFTSALAWSAAAQPAVPPEQAAWTYRYGATRGLAALGPLIAVVAIAALQVTAGVAAGAARHLRAAHGNGSPGDERSA